MSIKSTYDLHDYISQCLIFITNYMNRINYYNKFFNINVYIIKNTLHNQGLKSLTSHVIVSGPSPPIQPAKGVHIVLEHDDPYSLYNKYYIFYI